MAERHDVVIKVISQQGHCAWEHKVGDQWVVTGKTPAGICLPAFNALFPSLRMLAFGGSYPWESDPDVATAACPDFRNPVVFELRRVKK